MFADTVGYLKGRAFAQDSEEYRQFLNNNFSRDLGDPTSQSIADLLADRGNQFTSPSGAFRAASHRTSWAFRPGQLETATEPDPRTGVAL